MASYHFCATPISRGAGRSAVAASAYRSGTEMYNEYDGVRHDYTHKHGIAYEAVMLPPSAPSEWQDREVLWNAVEEAEKTKDSRLAREFNMALPIELGLDEWKRLLEEFIRRYYVDEGMCADYAIHNVDPNNPHAHLMVTVRPLDENGKWQAKTQKEYLCMRNGEERGFTAAEFKTAQNEGWEKQYQYKVGKKKVYMIPSAAEEQHLERASKHPKSTKYGRQNPIAERWNSEEQLLVWREAWQDAVNHALEQANRPERVDCRSFKDRGIDAQPTIHEGTAARMVEKKGGISERCELNRQIRKDNFWLQWAKDEVDSIREVLKQAKEKLAEKVKTIPEIAETLESLWRALVVNEYSKGAAQRLVDVGKETAAYYEPKRAKYDEIGKEIKQLTAKKKALIKERDALSPIQFFKRKELNDQIKGLEARLHGLREDQSELLGRTECNGEKDLKLVDQTIDTANKDVKRGESMLRRQETDRQSMVKQYEEEKKLVTPQNERAVMLERQYIRYEKADELASQMTDGKGHRSVTGKFHAENQVNRMLHEPKIELKKRPERMQPEMNQSTRGRRNDMEL